MRCSTFVPSSVLLSAAILFSSAALAQEPKPGKLKIWVHPSQAYTFLDQKAIGPGNQWIEVVPGHHKVMIANYGFKFFEQDVDVQPGQTASVNANLEPAGDPVSETARMGPAQRAHPWGRRACRRGDPRDP